MTAAGSDFAPLRRIAVIGAGQAGRRFALRCAQAGFDVILEDVMPANLRRAEAEFSDLSCQMPTGSMTFALTVEDAVRDADIAVDFVPDELESKLEIFCLIDRMAPPKTFLCTPSDALSITDLASCTYRGDRCFAVRGDLAVGSDLRILHPEGVVASATEQVRRLFVALNCKVSTEIDFEAPMLVKNSRM
jgi:3-hydroxybutyryl-CoA dehydrogenase